MDKEYKTCSRCGVEKPLCLFNKQHNGPNGRRSQCKECLKQYRIENKKSISERNRIYREKNIREISEKQKSYRENNKRKINEKKKLHYESNKEKIVAKSAKWYADNKSRKQEYDKKYRCLNKEKINIRLFEKYHSDPMFRLKDSVRSIIRLALKNRGFCKETSTHKILGCTFEYLMSHIERQFEPGMGWGNRSNWHIDHRIPVAAAKNKEQIIALNHYSNLRPMWELDNLSKGSSFCKKEAKVFFEKFGIEYD